MSQPQENARQRKVQPATLGGNAQKGAIPIWKVYTIDIPVHTSQDPR